MTICDHNYPRLKGPGLSSYRVGTEDIVLDIDSRKVFPPSETTLALAETLLRLDGNHVLDMGTGSALLAIVAAKARAKDVWAIDKNPKAIQCAAKNAELNEVGDKIHFEALDVFSWNTEKRFDLIVTNPPFMPMPPDAHFVSPEIELAIDGGLDGTDVLIAFAQKASELLSAEGRLILPIPHFVDYRRAEAHIHTLYSVAVIQEKAIRYWLAEYDEQFIDHILFLAGRNCVEICRCGGLIKTTLQILECRPLAQSPYLDQAD
jgi:HemK-related putative methylase